MFADRVKIRVKSGDGGNGVVSFRREAFVPRGGPDGGNGGYGGSVILEADSQLHTLLDFHHRSRFAAERGRHGSGGKCSGRNGADCVVKAPVGTRVYEGETLLVDLIESGQREVVAEGGRGGLGNAAFATPRNRAPRKATTGQPGEEHVLWLELKLMADVGLVGLPNAGKSTLLAALTAARPKIAPYPFTTLQPNLGIVRPTEFTSFVLADIPGLIEGASEGKGLGFEFLRHIERTRVLVFMVDVTSENPGRDLRALKAELKAWNADLLQRPSMVVLSKCDLAEERKRLRKPWTMYVSSATGENLDRLVNRIWEMLQSAPPPTVFRPPTFQPVPQGPDEP
ncbi:GTPase ObgE [bacterium]|nr:GTPase ObgE [bacterium]MBU1984749.1 GTPase ObgE [bacterium]